jgi:predicted dehydrogenase
MANEHSVLVVGVGSIGERHLRCFQSTGRASLSFVEINPELRASISKRYHVAGFGDLNDGLTNFLETSRSDSHKIAVICTPANHHIPMATKIAQAGVHVLIEKPLSTSLDGISNLEQIIAEQGIVAAVAYVLRSNATLASMRTAVLGGRFGTPVEVVAVCGQHFPTYRPAYAKTYYTNHATGGGAIQDALTHIINATEWIVGPVTRVIADADHCILKDVTVEDTAHVLARHGNVLASYNLNQHQAPNELTLTIICEGGTARWESHESRWRWMIEPGAAWNDETSESLPRDALFIEQANQFMDAVERRSPVVCSLQEAAQTLRVSLAALTSIKQQAWQTVRSHE